MSRPITECSYELQATLREFFRRMFETKGIEGVVQDLFALWDEDAPDAFWTTASNIFEKPDVSGPHLFTATATQLLRMLLKLMRSGSEREKHVARRILTLYPLVQDPTQSEMGNVGVITFRSIFIRCLLEEFDNPMTFHVLLQWLQSVPLPVYENLIIHLLIKKVKAGLTIDEKARVFLGALLGDEIVEAVGAFQDRRFWRSDVETIPGFEMLGRIDCDQPEYQQFREVLVRTRLQPQDWETAEYFDVLINSVNIAEDECEAIIEEALDTLGGDRMAVTSHLLDEGMTVKRSSHDLFGELLPRVTIARHPTLGECGAACSFTIWSSDKDVRPLKGLLDAEGDLSLYGIDAVTAECRAPLRAVLLDSLASVIVPRYVDEQSPQRHGARSGTETSAGGSTAGRPVIHLISSLNRRHGSALSGDGTRIPLGKAIALFQWLLGDIDLPNPFRLHLKAEEEGVNEATGRRYRDLCCPTVIDGREQLLKKELTLSQVYHRIVRAHALPTGARIDGERVVIYQPSPRALRQYDRFVKETGRTFVMSPLKDPKRYELEGIVHEVILPRTFNQGVFVSLLEIWEVLPLSDLKARAQIAFLLR